MLLKDNKLLILFQINIHNLVEDILAYCFKLA